MYLARKRRIDLLRAAHPRPSARGGGERVAGVGGRAEVVAVEAHCGEKGLAHLRRLVDLKNAGLEESGSLSGFASICARGRPAPRKPRCKG